jgi:hypothetical protein
MGYTEEERKSRSFVIRRDKEFIERIVLIIGDKL